jgi:predicted amidophosphoribosyltransferase
LSRSAKKIHRDATIIIVDDVVTSGGTIKEAARVLKPLHPSQIIYVSAASR